VHLVRRDAFRLPQRARCVLPATPYLDQRTGGLTW
jgi:hypothetical protein